MNLWQNNQYCKLRICPQRLQLVLPRAGWWRPCLGVFWPARCPSFSSGSLRRSLRIGWIEWAVKWAQASIVVWWAAGANVYSKKAQVAGWWHNQLVRSFSVHCLIFILPFPASLERFAALSAALSAILQTHWLLAGWVWLVYDQAFCEHAAATNHTDWSTINVQLFNFHAAGASVRSGPWTLI